MDENTDANIISKDEAQCLIINEDINTEDGIPSTSSRVIREDIHCTGKPCKTMAKPTQSTAELLQGGDIVSLSSETTVDGPVNKEDSNIYKCVLKEDSPSSVPFLSRTPEGIWCSSSDSHLMEKKTQDLEVRGSSSCDNTGVSTEGYSTLSRWTQKHEEQPVNDGNEPEFMRKEDDKKYSAFNKTQNRISSPISEDKPTNPKQILNDRTMRSKIPVPQKFVPRSSAFAAIENSNISDNFGFTVAGDSLLRSDRISPTEMEEGKLLSLKGSSNQGKKPRKKWELPTKSRLIPYTKRRQSADTRGSNENIVKDLYVSDYENQRSGPDLDVDDKIYENSFPFEDENSCLNFKSPYKDIYFLDEGRYGEHREHGEKNSIKENLGLNFELNERNKLNEGRSKALCTNSRQFKANDNCKIQCYLDAIAEMERLTSYIEGLDFLEKGSEDNFHNPLGEIHENLGNISPREYDDFANRYCIIESHSQPLDDIENRKKFLAVLDGLIEQLKCLREKYGKSTMANLSNQDEMKVFGEKLIAECRVSYKNTHENNIQSSRSRLEASNEGHQHQQFSIKPQNHDALINNNESNSPNGSNPSVINSSEENHECNSQNVCMLPRIDGMGDMPQNDTEVIRRLAASLCDAIPVTISRRSMDQASHQLLSHATNSEVHQQRILTEPYNFENIYYGFVHPAVIREIEAFTERTVEQIYNCEINEKADAVIKMKVEQRISSLDFRQTILLKVMKELCEQFLNQFAQDGAGSKQDKQLQTSDWTINPIPSNEELLEYIEMACSEVLKLWLKSIEKAASYDSDDDCLIEGILEDTDLDDFVSDNEYDPETFQQHTEYINDSGDDKDIENLDPEFATSTEMLDVNLSDIPASCSKEKS